MRPGSSAVGCGKLQTSEASGSLLAEDAADEGALGEPLALAFAGVHVEVDSADQLVVGGRLVASLSMTLKALTPGSQTVASSSRSKRTRKSLPAVARMPASTCS